MCCHCWLSDSSVDQFTTGRELVARRGSRAFGLLIIIHTSTIRVINFIVIDIDDIVYKLLDDNSERYWSTLSTVV